MEVICTQSKICNVQSIDLVEPHRTTTLYDGDAIFHCVHRRTHTHTPDCEIKCCDQVGIIKCRTLIDATNKIGSFYPS